MATVDIESVALISRESTSGNSSSTNKPFYDAVKNEKLDEIKILVRDSNADINSKDKQGWTALHLVAFMNYTAAANLLFQHPDIDMLSEDIGRENPLHVASYWDRTEIMDVLLTKGKEKGKLKELINAENNSNDTPFSYAASRYHKSACQKMLGYIPPLDIEISKLITDDEKGNGFCILSKEKVGEFLKKNTPVIHFHQKNKYGNSPINLLIVNFPELVKQILDNSIVEKIIEDIEARTHEDTCRVVLDFGALEEYKEDGQEINSFKQAGGIYVPGSYEDGNYPLQVMAKKKRFDLLKHPVVEALIKKKWESYARTYFYVKVFIYVLFVIILLTFELSLQSSDSENGGRLCKDHLCTISGYGVCVMSMFRLFLVIMDFVNETVIKKDRYATLNYSTCRHVWNGLRNYITSPSNSFVVMLYGTAVVFSLGYFPVNFFSDRVITSFQWKIGTLCVFTAFINLLMILRVFPYIGLHIIMFIRICKTFITKTAFLLVFFIFAFIIILNMLLSQQGNGTFKNPVNNSAVFKVLSMGVNGIDFEDYDMPLKYPDATLVAFITFAIFFQVLFLNMVTGIALEDVREIRAHSKGEMNALYVEHIYHSENLLLIMQSILCRCGIVKGTQLLRCQKRFQNMDTRGFDMDKIKALSELDENKNV